MLNPYHQAVSMYEAIGETDENLRIDMAWHCCNGYVYASPLGLAMARPVSSKWSKEQILDYTERGFELTDTLNCWHVHIVVGDLSHLLSLIPHPLELMSFERRGKLKFYPFNRFYEDTKTTSAGSSITTSKRKR
jgi:hypothetical protein